MRKVAVFTGTRAEYGLLYWLLKDIQADLDLELQLLVSAMHLSPEFGLTYKQIEEDGFEITEKVEMLLSSNTSVGTAKSIGLGVIGFADALDRMNPDLIIILGDRFEALSVAQTAMILRVPIVHIHGGEITEGAYDDAIRHAITKLSFIHFTSTPEHKKRVIQLGENPNRVFDVGAVGLDHLHRSKLMTLEELSASLAFKIDRPYLLVTYHSVTLASEPATESFNNLLKALDEYRDYQIILTYPNADDGGREIIPFLEAYASNNSKRVLAIPSLGQLRYLSAVKYASAVVGNSSSGIIEVPSFKVPTINIGERQRGRMAANSVFNCDATTVGISTAIKEALAKKLSNVVNPYGKGNASESILTHIKATDLSAIKVFYDLKKDNC